MTDSRTDLTQSRTLRPFAIGPIRVELPVTLASLAGYSDLAYRLICRELGAGFCGTEAMLDKQMLVDGKLRRRLVRLTEDDHPISGQIMGSDPATMAAAGRALCEMGFDVVDLNFACPVKKVLSRRRGGWLMNRPARAGEIIRAVAGEVDRPLTIKLRRSFAEADGPDNVHRITDEAFEAGAAAVCIHGRSVEAKYTGHADWDFIADFRRRYVDRPVLGSGDLLTPADALAMLDRTGVDAVTAARGAIGNPWFFRQVRDLAAGREPCEPDLAEQRELIARHFDLAVDLYGPKRGPKHMRKFGIKYSRLHPTPAKVRAAFVAVRSPKQFHRVLEEFYRPDAAR